MANNELPADTVTKKDGIGFRILLKVAGAIGIGWAVMLLIVRVLGIIVGLVASPVVGFAILLAYPDAPSLVHWGAFILTPLVVWGATELFIWYYQSPIDTWVRS